MHAELNDFCQSMQARIGAALRGEGHDVETATDIVWTNDLAVRTARRLADKRPDLTIIKPEIDATVSGNQVNITWGWGGNSAFLDMCELQVDRGDNKGFVLLAFDTTPNYTDTQPFPAAPVKWAYQAIYRVGDQRVGQWSKPVSVTVGG